MQDVQRDDDVRDIMALAETRRGLFRRSLLGLTGLGVAGFLVACGGDDDADEDSGLDEGAEDPGEQPGIETETGIEARDDATEDAGDDGD